MSDLAPRRKGIFGRRLCNWEGRYDYKPPVNEANIANIMFWNNLRSAELRSFGTETYVREVCTRCGQTKERTI